MSDCPSRVDWWPFPWRERKGSMVCWSNAFVANISSILAQEVEYRTRRTFPPSSSELSSKRHRCSRNDPSLVCDENQTRRAYSPQSRFRFQRNSSDRLMGEYHFSSEIRVYMVRDTHMGTEFAVDHWSSHTGTLFHSMFLRYEHLRQTKSYPLLCRESSRSRNARNTLICVWDLNCFTLKYTEKAQVIVRVKTMDNVFKMIHIAYMAIVAVDPRTHSPLWVWRQTLDLNNRGWLTANGCVHVRLSWERENDQCSDKRRVMTGWNVETSRSECTGNAKASAWRSLAWIKSRPSWISLSGDSDVLSQTCCRSCDSRTAYITALTASGRPPWPIHRRVCILTDCFHCSISAWQLSLSESNHRSLDSDLLKYCEAIRTA